MTHTYEAYEAAVVAKVVERIGTLSWFKGVCTDTVKASYHAGKYIHEAALEAEMDTMYYDSGFYI